MTPRRSPARPQRLERARARRHAAPPPRRAAAAAAMDLATCSPRRSPASSRARRASALTVLGTVIGVGALVATLGLSKTAGNQIVGRFDALAATDIVVSPSARAGGAAPTVAAVGRRGAPPAAQRRRGRRHALRRRRPRRARALGPGQRPARRRSDPAADEGGVPRPVPRGARPARRRAVLRRRPLAARRPRRSCSAPTPRARLASRESTSSPAIFIGDRLYTVDRPARRRSGARRRCSARSRSCPRAPRGASSASRRPRSAQVETRIGAVDLIARQAPMALSPTDPTLLKVAAPPDPRAAAGRGQERPQRAVPAARRRVAARRARSASPTSRSSPCSSASARSACAARSAPARRHIAAQFLLESTAMGLAGGIIGASLGTLVVVGVSASQHLDAGPRPLGAARRAAARRAHRPAVRHLPLAARRLAGAGRGAARRHVTSSRPWSQTMHPQIVRDTPGRILAGRACAGSRSLALAAAAIGCGDRRAAAATGRRRHAAKRRASRTSSASTRPASWRARAASRARSATA